MNAEDQGITSANVSSSINSVGFEMKSIIMMKEIMTSAPKKSQTQYC